MYYLLDLPEDDSLLYGMLPPYQHLEDTTFLQNVCSSLQLSNTTPIRKKEEERAFSQYQRTKKLQKLILATRPYRASSQSIPPLST